MQGLANEADGGDCVLGQSTKTREPVIIFTSI